MQRKKCKYGQLGRMNGRWLIRNTCSIWGNSQSARSRRMHARSSECSRKCLRWRATQQLNRPREISPIKVSQLSASIRLIRCTVWPSHGAVSGVENASTPSPNQLWTKTFWQTLIALPPGWFRHETFSLADETRLITKLKLLSSCCSCFTLSFRWLNSV